MRSQSGVAVLLSLALCAMALPIRTSGTLPSMFARNKPVQPRNGHTLVAGIVARISGCRNQKELSLDDQVDHAKEEIGHLYDGPVDYRVIATRGKGERIDREELARIDNMIRSRELDLLVMEDLGRLVRGAAASGFLGLAVDHGVRVVVPNDCLDTADLNWEQDSLTACAEHVGHNAHTSKRIKYKLMNRFVKFGGAMARPIAGYIIPDGVRTYDGWQKVETATAVIKEGASRLRASGNCTAVADWLNEIGFDVGKYCRREKWEGAMVRRFFSNPLLIGKPQRGARHTVKHHADGRRVSVPNPDGALSYQCPHLAHLTEEEFAETNAVLTRIGARYCRKKVKGEDPLKGVPRKRTRFPGQHSMCWCCGRQHVWGGNGMTGNLMCKGAREWRCWNSVGFNGALLAKKVAEALHDELLQLDGMEEQFRGLIVEAMQAPGEDLAQKKSQLQQDEAKLAREEKNVSDAVLTCGPSPLLKGMLEKVEAERRDLARRRHELELASRHKPELPASLAELRSLVLASFQSLATDSPEFGDVLRKLVPEVHVYLVRLCDSDRLLPRARVVLALDGLTPELSQIKPASHLLRRELQIDLFEPPQRERIRQQVVELTADSLTQDQIVLRIAERPTKTAVQHALALHREMLAQGLSTPYVPVTEPTDRGNKMRRHRNRKYRFERLEGYAPPRVS